MHNENCGFKAHHKEQSEKSTNSIELLQNKPCMTVNDVHTNHRELNTTIILVIKPTV